MNTRFFPYDQQNCTLTFGSWTSGQDKINYYVEKATVNMHDYVPHEEWDVVSFETVRQEVPYCYQKLL